MRFGPLKREIACRYPVNEYIQESDIKNWLKICRSYNLQACTEGSMHLCIKSRISPFHLAVVLEVSFLIKASETTSRLGQEIRQIT